MGDNDELRDSVALVLSMGSPVIERAQVRKWDPEQDGLLPLIYRAVLIRQYDLLSTILHLEETERGYAAVVLLRPAVEELIWCSYLSQIEVSAANRLLSLMNEGEVHDNLKAEYDFSGKGATESLGLLDHLNRFTRVRPRFVGNLQKLGRELGWKRHTIEQGSFPSLEFVASRAELKKEYNYLYHATSRYVHFSTSELLRRAWGTRDRVTISSENFSTYWGAFALKWGFWVYTKTYLLLQPHLEADGIEEPKVDEGRILDAFKRIAEFGHVPIITAHELRGEGF